MLTNLRTWLNKHKEWSEDFSYLLDKEPGDTETFSIRPRHLVGFSAEDAQKCARAIGAFFSGKTP
jgi:hypothetical protein